MATPNMELRSIIKCVLNNVKFKKGVEEVENEIMIGIR